MPPSLRHALLGRSHRPRTTPPSLNPRISHPDLTMSNVHSLPAHPTTSPTYDEVKASIDELSKQARSLVTQVDFWEGHRHELEQHSDAAWRETTRTDVIRGLTAGAALLERGRAEVGRDGRLQSCPDLLVAFREVEAAVQHALTRVSVPLGEWHLAESEKRLLASGKLVKVGNAIMLGEGSGRPDVDEDEDEGRA